MTRCRLPFAVSTTRSIASKSCRKPSSSPALPLSSPLPMISPKCGDPSRAASRVFPLCCFFALEIHSEQNTSGRCDGREQPGGTLCGSIVKHAGGP